MSNEHSRPHVAPLPMAEAMQQSVRQALMAEAMQWTADARVEVWMALMHAGKRMGIVITKDELYALQREGQQQQQQEQHADGTPPACPRCGDNRQVWRNQISREWTCHRAWCHTEINTEAKGPRSGPA